MKAKVLLVRVTIPVNIYNSPIVVEIDGVESQIHVQLRPGKSTLSTPISRTDHDRNRNQPPSNRSTGSTSGVRRGSGVDGEDDLDPHIPTPTDLAQSFLQAEPIAERAGLEAAILSETQDLGASSVLSEDGELPEGTGITPWLPAFLAKFLQGILDRLQVKIHGITVDLDVDIPAETPKSQLPNSSDCVTVRLRVEDVDIQGVTSGVPTSSAEPDNDSESLYKDGKRLIRLSDIRGTLISEASVFSSLARSSTLSSPSTVHSEFAERKSASKTASSIHRSVVRSTEDISSPENSSVASSRRLSSAAQSKLAVDSQLLAGSIMSSNNGRFDDAPEEDEVSNMSESVQLSEASDSVFQNSAFFDQVAESQCSQDGSNQEGSPRLSSSPRMLPINSPLSTPRASMHLSGEARDEALSVPQVSRERVPASMLRSTVLPTRHHPRFSDDRVSRSQPALPGEHKGTRFGGQDGAASAPILADVSPHSDGEDDFHDTVGEDLARSQLFSHEDAESVYMSVYSHASASSAHVPGGWESSEEENHPNSLNESRISTREDTIDNLDHALHVSSLDGQHENDIIVSSSTRSEQERVSSSSSSSSSPSLYHSQHLPEMHQVPSNLSERSTTSSSAYGPRLLKQFFTLDDIKIYLPALNEDLSVDPSEFVSGTLTYAGGFDGQKEPACSTSINVPGAFSTHPLPQNVLRKPVRVQSEPRSDTLRDQQEGIEILVGSLVTQFDVSIAKLVYKMIEQVKEIFKQELPPSPVKTAESVESKLRLEVKLFSARFLSQLGGTLSSGRSETSYENLSTDILLQLNARGLKISTQTVKSITKTSLTLEKFVFGYAQEDILFFDSDLQMGASVRDLRASAGIDISVNITQTPEALRFEIITLPLHVAIDLQRLDETFSWFGGLSSVLNLGSSIASNSTVTAMKAKPKLRSVRFETPIRPDDKSVASQNKADVRIGGFLLDLIGAECRISARTSAVKLVSRDEGIGVTIQKMGLTGPHLRNSAEEPAITLDVNMTRVEYRASPQDSDLERLLSLITPSKAKYDQDDDILLDTLLRQRKQGAVLTVKIDDFQASVSRIAELSYLPELGEEVARLATVAKYLPDDDRPGLLSLISVLKFGANIDFDNAIGTIKLSSSEVEVAQISLPSLIAMSIGGVSARRNITEELLGFATDPKLREPRSRSPAIMARMIGDEMEPTVKIKLWNMKVEYCVPTLMVLLGLADDATANDMSASIVASVATITDFAGSNVPQDKPRSSPSTPASRPMKIDVVLRDCIIGLNPLGQTSKMLVVLTEARSTVLLPKDGNANASLDLSKASLLIIDNVAHLVAPSLNARNRRQSFDGGSTQVADLAAMGYVSVSYISSAKAIITMTTSEDQEPSIDVELRDDLFVLESCADSTQTLISVLSNLAPPTPPSKEIKYRTKVIPVHDLLASLSGDAFGTAEGAYNIDDDFHLPTSSDDDFSSIDEVGNDFEVGYGQQVMEDLFNLDDKGQSSQITSRDTQDGVLLGSFVGRVETEEAVDLDFREDHFGTGSIPEGTAHRWNSAKNTYDRSNTYKIRKSPLKVCVRDVHIIWNLFDGYDWQNTRDTITKAIHDVESKAIEKRARQERPRPAFEIEIEDDETVIGDFLFNSIYIGIPSHREGGDLSAAVNREINVDDTATETESIATTTLSASPSRQGGARKPKGKKLRLGRSKRHKITFELKGFSVDFVAFPPGSGETQSSIDVRVHDLDVFDHVPTSTWRKFATYMQDAGERESGSSMIHIEILNVKPVPDLAASEIVLKVTVLPLRLHVDQDALDFITRFFEFKDDSVVGQPSVGEPPFLQRVEVNSIQVKLDFKPKRVDYAGLRSGHTTEFMNFLILDEADMVMRHTIIYGVSGFDKLGKCLNDIWMPDIKRNQLPGILAGLAPVRSLVNVGGGLRQLVVVPVREYKKDGRIVRSISKGAAAFAKTTGTELVKLGAKMAIGVQTVLQGAEDFLAPTSASYTEEDSEDEARIISPYANQPVGVMQGMRGGYRGLQRDLVLARDAIIAVPGEAMQGGTAKDIFSAVGKHAPTVILRPAIAFARATGQTLLGAANSLDKNNLKRAKDVSRLVMKISGTTGS